MTLNFVPIVDFSTFKLLDFIIMKIKNLSINQKLDSILLRQLFDHTVSLILRLIKLYVNVDEIIMELFLTLNFK